MRLRGRPPRLATARSATPLARNPVIERQRVGEAGLEKAQARGAKRPLLLTGCDEQSEVQLRNRDRADRRFGLCRDIAHDQDRGIKQEPQPGPSLGSPGVAQLCAKVLDVPGECRVGRKGPQIAKLRASHPLTSPHRPQRRHRTPETVIVISSPASARRNTSPTLLRSSFRGATGVMVAVLLPPMPRHHGSNIATSSSGQHSHWSLRSHRALPSFRPTCFSIRSEHPPRKGRRASSSLTVHPRPQNTVAADHPFNRQEFGPQSRQRGVVSIPSHSSGPLHISPPSAG